MIVNKKITFAITAFALLMAPCAIAQKPVEVPKPVVSNPTTGSSSKTGASEKKKGSGKAKSSSKSKTEKTQTPESRFRVTYAKAMDGDSRAQTELAQMYAEGRGTQKDDAKAFRWWLEAADQGVAQAQLEVGMCYKNGVGSMPNAEQAALWFNTVIGNSNASFIEVEAARNLLREVKNEGKDKNSGINATANVSQRFPASLSLSDFASHLYGILPLSTTESNLRAWAKKENYTLTDNDGFIDYWAQPSTLTIDNVFTPRLVCFRVKYVNGVAERIENWFYFKKVAARDHLLQKTINEFKMQFVSNSETGTFWNVIINGRKLWALSRNSGDYYILSLFYY